MDLTILSPHRKLFEKEAVTELYAPGVEGQLDVLLNHANFVTVLETGVLRWKNGDAPWKSAAISTGFLEIFDGHITILADVSELSAEISVERAKKAGEFARQKLEEGGLDQDNFRKFELKLKRSMARQGATSAA
jgi:F-type H+-transporting ATPase subunit epsilon